MASDSKNKRTAGQRLSAWRKKGSAAADTGYRICYGTGLYTVRLFRAIGKRIRRTAGPAAGGFFA